MASFLKSKKFLWSLPLLLLLGAAAFQVLITPNNPLTRLFRGKITATDSKVIIGPYPLETDFPILKKHEVTAIVSLLDERLPYEKVLLDRERALAQQYQIKVLNYPMSSIFGQALDADHEQRVTAAAAAIAKEPGKVYLHCYLGLHRAKAVEEAVRRQGATTDTYLVRKGERSEQARQLDQAQADYDAGHYREALEKLGKISPLDPPGQLLQAWASYRLGEMPAAREHFNAIRRVMPENEGAQIGLGYCALRDNQLTEAEAFFFAVLKLKAENPEALMGLGLVEYRQGREKEAALHLEAVLRLNPKNEEARDLLKQIRG